MSDLDHPNNYDYDFETAVAAAAYAITCMDEEEGLRRTPTRLNSKQENSINKQTETSKVSRWLSGKEAKENGKSTGERSMRKFATFDERLLKNFNSSAEKQTSKRETGEKTTRKSKTLDQLMLEELIDDQKVKGTTPTIKKTPTFTYTYLNDMGNNRIEGGQPEAFRNPRSMKSRKEETLADIWERERMEKIIKWYEKMNYKILQWENMKKLKAKRKLERQESELTKRRAMYLQANRNEISRIDNMAGGAKTISEERKRNKELKTKEKANRIRSTEKVPRKCFCL